MNNLLKSLISVFTGEVIWALDGSGFDSISNGGRKMKIFKGVTHFLGECYTTFKDTFRGYGRPEWIFCIVVTVVFLAIGSAIYYRYEYEMQVTVCHRVISVGSCGRGGMCGVQFDSGTRGIAYLPVQGQRLCIPMVVAKPSE